MSIVFLNNDYMPMAEARISPMDRGFLFGDGIYEVIPSYDGQLVGFGPHIQRMRQGLAQVKMHFAWHEAQWRTVCHQLMKRNQGSNLGLYLHVSRGADSKRFHAYPENIEPTVFAFTFEIPPAPVADKNLVQVYRVATTQDLRWHRCNIKSTALLGNVMHFQQGYEQGYNETLLFNEHNELTEGSACNAYLVKNKEVITPPLDSQILPGITRFMLLDILTKHSDLTITERIVTKEELLNADEVWLTSSSKEIAPVIEIDGVAVGDGLVGDVWLTAQLLYSRYKFEY